MLRSPLNYFIDPVLKAPTIGCMLMCLAASLVGVLVFLRKESLLGESLSHAAYPGIIFGVVLAGFLFGDSPNETSIAVTVLAGAYVTSFIGLKVIAWLEERLRLRSDSALTFVLATFMGIGLTAASHIQFTHTALYRQAQSYLFGQAATMTDQHIYMYAILAGITIAMVLLFYKELQVITFDRDFARTVGFNVPFIDLLVFLLIVLAVVLGLRSVGVVLISAMFIAPPVAARQYTNRMSIMFLIAGTIGVVSGFLGNYLSVEVATVLEEWYPGLRLPLPTGPMIIIVASIICILSLLLAPERGLLRRLLRMARFRYDCLCENILKSIWLHGARAHIAFDEIAKYQGISRCYLHIILFKLMVDGWMVKMRSGSYRLTKDGRLRASRIIRLHRLWELYLTDQLGLGVERIHRNAEEMEHILTPEIEEQLTQLLQHPTSDPHHQPIPPRRPL